MDEKEFPWEVALVAFVIGCVFTIVVFISSPMFEELEDECNGRRVRVVATAMCEVVEDCEVTERRRWDNLQDRAYLAVRCDD